MNLNFPFKTDPKSMPNWGTPPVIFSGEINLKDIHSRSGLISQTPDSGMYQVVYSLSKEKVLKILHRPEFRAKLYACPKSKKEKAHNNLLWGILEFQQQRVESNHNLLRNLFGDLFPESKVSICCSKKNDEQMITAVIFKIQKNLSCMKKHYSIRGLSLDSGQNKQLFEDLIIENPRQKVSEIFRQDALKLLENWKKLKASGLTLDICFNRNITISGNPDRIKLFDSLPLLKVDKKLFRNSDLYSQNLITITPAKETLQASEDFFNYLSELLEK